MRRLRECIGKDEKLLFSKCIIRFKENGYFKADYFYEEIDWLDIPDWNFPEAQVKN
jgi:hypothetical protein